ncbi:MAG TPA: alpha/beta hydrolase [Casimicrobiaceae bacterium]|nr:alpha/beta hydrolase [Casimicrobiaceae bacterium]
MPFVHANGIRTFYRTAGEGPPLLLIAGNGMDHTCFDEQLRSFAPHFTCIVYDLRGIGQSDVPEDGYTTMEMAKDAFALLDALGIDGAHVGGYSLGGAIGQHMAASSPQRVRSLSLYSTFDRPDPYLRLRYDLLLKILLETTPGLWAMFTAFSAFGPEYINAHDAVVREEIARREARWKLSDAPSKIGLAGHYRAILDHDASERLRSIRCPAWIAVGSQDPVTPVSYSQRLHAAIAGSRLEIFPDRPHRILNFAAERFTERALAFLLENR